MRKTVLGALGAVLLAGAGLSAYAAAAVAPYVAAAIADPARPKEDTDRDAARKPAEMLAFAGVKPGEKIAEMLPGGGYFTRIFAKAVGPKGKVYAVVPPATIDAKPPVAAIAAAPGYANVVVLAQSPAALTTPEPVDLVWTSQNYHDLHLKRFNLDVAAVNKSVYAALKPGGLYVILDHAALAGEPVDAADRYHRIDPAIVRKEVEAAGFKFEAENSSLRNPADPHNILVFDPSIRGHTDQFIYKFRKPK
jgi:predicted methyltransferase